MCHASLWWLLIPLASSGILISTTASLVALWVATVTVFRVVTAVLSWQNFKLKQKGMLTAKPYRWYRDDNYSECFNMQLTTDSSPFLFQSPDKEAPPTLPLPLLSSHSSPPLPLPPKALTASSYNQIPATVQWRGPDHQWQCNSSMLEWM